MPYWLCDKRDGQDSAPLMRFDPRYWTVNFPRPAMASVVTIAPDALRVDASFYHADELVGLIWDSEDRIDHPLLAYETNRDYRRLTLKFRWRSAGILPLDAINGPVLTLVGRDASGAPKAWYVRLWNYAAGTPEDAQITIPFSDISGGFLLPQEADPVFAGDIDQMFISVVAASFDNSNTPFASVAEGWVELSDIRCDGAGVMLDTGDVMLPEHALKMATGYDDSYNQTPERMVRNIHALGYRGLINHYVGMSHYYRLDPLAGGHYVSLGGGALNGPCAKWHRHLADSAKVYGFDLIFSLSYELFDANCWNDWKQRAENGDAALTGWVPPSALLSPAHDGAIAYLAAVARAFVYIQKLAGLPVKFQIGEPWWWVMPDKRICLYDAAATAKFGALSVSIASINGPKTAPQIAMLDKAGELLATSTNTIFAAAKTEALPQSAETLLLAYLPSILDDAASEARRANVPVGWANPAFDILQLEDYDWVTTANHGATIRGIAEMESRLGYPRAKQHYFAGFVLNATEKAQWRDIALAAQSGIDRNTSENFVWAYPQVARDGFTYFQISTAEESEVRSFDDIMFPLAIGQQAELVTAFSTNIVASLSGHERRNSDWADARLSYDVSPGVRSEADMQMLVQFFRARRGPAVGFRFRDPFDHSSHGMTGVPEATDQSLGNGDGVRTKFALLKHYGEGAETQQRRISRPVETSVVVALNGMITSGWSLGEFGEIGFSQAPAPGQAVTAGYYFDVPVRFASDQLAVSATTFGAGSMPDVSLIEIREAS